MRKTTLEHAASFLAALILFAGCGDSTTPAPTQPLPPATPEVVAAVEVTGATLLAQGDSIRLTATVRSVNGQEMARTVTWKSSDTTVARVSQSGVVTAVGRTGSAEITASAETKSAAVNVPVWWLYRTPVRYANEQWADVTVVDSARGRTIPVRVRWPIGAPQPLPVVFDIATNSSTTGLSAWGTVFMTAGYAVVLNANPLPDEKTCEEFKVPASECAAVIAGGRGANSNPIISLASARDASSVLDRLPAIANQLGVQLDMKRVAATGTSRGGAAALFLAGYTVDVSPSARNVSTADSRFVAIVANAPPGLDSTLPPCGCTATSWQSITVPTFIQTSTGDTWGRREPFDRMPAGNKHLIFFNTTGIDHLAFGLEFKLSNIPKHQFADYISLGPVAFLDAYLRDNAEAKAWLKNNELARGTGGVVQVSSK